MLLLSLLACSTPSAPPPVHPDVLLVTLDTTRADALGCYGQVPSPTPVIDGLAARGARFDEVQTTAPLTLPAHASILTGLDPDEHGVRDNNGYHLSEDQRSLAENLSQAGYHTGAFVAALVLDASFGLDQGFSTYHDGFDLTRPAGGAEGLLAWHRGEEVAARATAWLAEQPAQEPVFLWVHLYDPHMPYQPEAELLQRLGDPYLAEVAYADAQVGAVLSALQARQRPRVVAVVGDHGEGRGEHGEATHGHLVYRSTMRVPLVLAGEGVPAGLVVDRARSITALAPTLASLAGVEALPGAHADLVADLQGEAAPSPPLYAETLYPRRTYGMSELRVLQDDQWRFILAPRPELFSWREDPGETRDLAADHPELVLALTAVLEGRHSGASTHHVAGASTRQALAALGYVDGLGTASSEASWRDLPDPKDHPDLMVRWELLVLQARTRPPDQAVPLLEAFLEEHPAVGAARQLLAQARTLSGDLEDAVSDLDLLLQAHPGDPLLLTQRAEVLMELGRHEACQADLEQALATNPDLSTARAIQAEDWRRQGRCDLALEATGLGLATAPEEGALRLVRGACLLERGDARGAEADLRSVHEADPQDAEATLLLGSALAARGRASEAIPLFEGLLEEEPRSPEILLALGKARYQEGLLEEAEEPLRLAGEAGRGEAHLILADTLLRLGHPPEEALRHLDQAEALSPQDEQIHRVRASALMSLGRTAEALVEMERAHQP